MQLNVTSEENIGDWDAYFSIDFVNLWNTIMLIPFLTCLLAWLKFDTN